MLRIEEHLRALFIEAWAGVVCLRLLCVCHRRETQRFQILVSVANFKLFNMELSILLCIAVVVFVLCLFGLFWLSLSIQPPLLELKQAHVIVSKNKTKNVLFKTYIVILILHSS